MQNQSTQLLFNTKAQSGISGKASATHISATPRETTLEMIRRFARTYHIEAGCSMAVAVLLN